MNKKYFSYVLTLLLIVTLLFTSQNKSSYSLEENSSLLKIINLDLEYTSNKDILENNLLNFINEIDDTLIPLYEYHEDLALNDNYQFMTTFAINFIANHLAYYQDQIIHGADYQTTDDSGNNYQTNQYIPLDLLYDITSSVFNRRYYHITNPELSINNNQVPLINQSYPIEMHIEKINQITHHDEELLVSVKYTEMDFYYQYEFVITDNKLSLKNLNIEV